MEGGAGQPRQRDDLPVTSSDLINPFFLNLCPEKGIRNTVSFED